MDANNVQHADLQIIYVDRVDHASRVQQIQCLLKTTTHGPRCTTIPMRYSPPTCLSLTFFRVNTATILSSGFGVNTRLDTSQRVQHIPLADSTSPEIHRTRPF